MKGFTIFLKILAYGLLIPLAVFFLADFGIKISCKYYWAPEYLCENFGFKLGMHFLLTMIGETIIYYLFCIIFRIVKRKVLRHILLALFLISPIIYDILGSRYDLMVIVSYAVFHSSFYVLFIIMRYGFNHIKAFKKDDVMPGEASS